MATGTQEHFSHILKHGLARSNRFQVLIPLPTALGNLTTSDSQRKVSTWLNSDVVKLINSFTGSGTTEVTRGLSLMIESTEIPGKNLNTTDIKYNGDHFKLPYGVVYPAQQFTFRVSANMYEKNILDEWMNLIFNPVTHEVAYMDDFCVNITINQLDEQDRVVYSVMLRDAFPTLANPLTVSNEESNQFHRMVAMFAYRRWERIGEGENIMDGGVTNLSQTVLGPILAPVLTNPVAKTVFDIIESNTGISLVGEAAELYNYIDLLVKETTGSNINTTILLIERIKADLDLNDHISFIEKAQLLEYIESLVGAMMRNRDYNDYPYGEHILGMSSTALDG